MHAAILDHGDRAVRRARHDHRRRTDIGADEIARIWDLGLERDIVPGRTVENALDLALVDGLVGVDPVRNLREVAGPDILLVEQDTRARAAPAIASREPAACNVAVHAGLHRAKVARHSM